jgi:DNA-binding MarR family transcriptional regulator
MSSVSSGGDTDRGDVDPRRRRRLTTTVKDSVRDLRNQLAVLNHQVSARLELRETDLDCLDLIARHGPLSPSALARQAGLHPATMTGVLDRLQRAGWITRDREPDATDRRAVTVRALRERLGEVVRAYAGMNSAMDQLCAGYSAAELELIADFLHRATDAGQTATAALADDRRTG